LSLRDDLRRLRREPARPEPPQPPAPEAPPGAGVRERLARRGARAEGGEPSAGGASGEGWLALGPPRDLVEEPGALGPVRARCTRLADDHLHGEFRLSEIEHAGLEEVVRLTGDPALADLDLRRAVYLDTETTGLSGGAGTYVFLVGLGRFVPGEGFEVWQGFLAGPEEEAALLEACAARLREASGVVSFFGKSFDRHRLEDKMRLHGVEPPFAALPHLDLYHPLRRLYRDAHEDGRLKTLEAALCGLDRPDDLPGSQAPAAWFDHLAGRAHRLEGVFRHNLDDVLSLVTLAAHLGRSESEVRGSGEPLSGDGATRALGLARAAASRGEREHALAWLERALERGAGPRRVLELERADLLRLLRRDEEALAAYRELAEGGRDEVLVPALLELAKLLEHRVRDRVAARESCLRALELVDALHVGARHARLRTDLERRLARLER
jgi:uncharacterized protein YprB with RNaseH-like and TPR domain